MHTNLQRLLNLFAALATFLGCIAWINEFHSRPGAFCLEREDAEEAGPASVSDATGQSAVLEHPLDVQVFRSNESVAGNELIRSLVVHVASRVGNMFMQSSYLEFDLLSSVTSFLATGQCPLFDAKFGLVASHYLGVAERFSVASSHERLQTNVDSDFSVGYRDLVFGCFDGEADVPLSGLAFDDRLLDVCVRRKFTMPADSDGSNVLKPQLAIDDLATTAIPSHAEEEGVELVGGLESRIAWISALRAASKERSERLIESLECFLRRTEIQIGEESVVSSLMLEPSGLIEVVPVGSSRFPARLLSRQAFIVEPAMRFKCLCKFFFLRGVREQSEAVCFNHVWRYLI